MIITVITSAGVSDLSYLMSIYHLFIFAYRLIQVLCATSLTQASAQSPSHFDISNLACFPEFTLVVLDQTIHVCTHMSLQTVLLLTSQRGNGIGNL